ncbi:MAG: AbiH family protein [Spirosomataceae bacterium]
MNILFIIGNGFDINLGLKTRYQDFYDFYISKPSKSSTIYELKNNISKDLKNWANLELELGKYTKNISSIDEFDEIYDDLIQHLGDYLEEQENSFLFKPEKLENFLSDLFKLDSFLSPAEKVDYETFTNIWKERTWKVNLMTFNYTKIIEKILGEAIEQNMSIGKHHETFDVVFQGLVHIHGYHDERMILGVNDVSQIQNIKLHMVEDICGTFIKSEYNKGVGELIHERCEHLVNNANLICIFGSSIGDTDKIWWELIGKRLRENSRLIIFKREGSELNLRFSSKTVRLKNKTKEDFLIKTNFNEKEKEEIKKKMYVAINSTIFSNLK